MMQYIVFLLGGITSKINKYLAEKFYVKSRPLTSTNHLSIFNINKRTEVVSYNFRYCVS